MPRLSRKLRKSGAVSRANRARDLGQWGLAAGLYRQALDRNPRNPGIWVQYGHALKEAGELRDPDKLAQAEIAYRRAISLDPGTADPHLQLGHALKLQGKTEEGKASYLRAFALDPSMPYPLQELSGLGWSETYLSELKGMVSRDIANPVPLASENGTSVKHSPIPAAEGQPVGLRQDDLTSHVGKSSPAPEEAEGVQLIVES